MHSVTAAMESKSSGDMYKSMGVWRDRSRQIDVQCKLNSGIDAQQGAQIGVKVTLRKRLDVCDKAMMGNLLASRLASRLLGFR